jgi:predicted nucleic acid-binding protein
VDIVLDASLALAWVLPDEANEAADRLLDALTDETVLVVPSIWFSEVANALVKKLRIGRLQDAQFHTAREEMQDLPLRAEELPSADILGPVAELARARSLSVYDASYLHVALTRRVPLATLDLRLRAAAEAAGCELFE